MFTNVPEKLERFVRAIPSRFPTEVGTDAKYLYAAMYAAVEYINLKPTLSVNQEFLGYDPGPTSTPKAKNMVMMLGSSLFMLRSTKAFPEICRRLQIDIRSAFYEMLAARSFFEAGFDIDMRREIGTKGEDFDFFGIRDGERINGEATALAAKQFSTNTMLNALNRKRRQLPKTHPNIVYCLVPQAWGGRPTKAELDHVVAEFFRGTGRVNAIVFQFEMSAAWPSGAGSLAFGVLRYVNNKARWPIRDLAVFDVPGTEFTPRMRAALAGTGPIAPLKSLRDRNEFFQWVDALVPTSST